MKVVVYLNDNSQPWALKWANAFIDGARLHGVDIERREIHKLVTCDIAVIWGVGKQHIIDRQKEDGNDYLVMERGYIGNRQQWMSLGFNDLNGHADFRNKNSGAERWNSCGWEMADWKRDGKYILVAGQVPGDNSVKHLNIREVIQASIDYLNKASFRPVLYRPHPLAKETWRPRDCKVSEDRTLKQDLENAFCCVTINSNTGVDATMAGVPVVTLDRGAMAWDIAGHDVKDALIPKRPDRTQWAWNMAYTQWNEDEVRRGEAWAHLVG